MDILTNLIQKLIERGKNNISSSYHLINKVLNISLLYSMISVISSLSTILSLDLEGTAFVWVQLSIFCCSLILYLVRGWGGFFTARILLILSMNINILIFSGFFSYYAGIIIFFFPLVTFPFLLFNHYEQGQKWMFSLVSLGFFFVALLEIIPPLSEFHLPVETEKLLNNVGFAQVIIILLVMTYYYDKLKSKIEVELISNTDMLKEAQTIAHLGNWVYDLTLQSWYWSDELYDILGFSKDRKITTDEFYGFIHPYDRLKVKDALEEVLKKPDYLKLEYRVYNSEQKEIFLLMICKPVADARGKVHMVKGIIQDITDQKQAEYDLVESQVSLAEAQGVAAMGSWEYYYKTDELKWSDQLYKLYGVKTGTKNHL